MATVLVVGTRNPKKRQELLEILGDLELDLRDLTGWAEVSRTSSKTADTFEANARKKALELSRHLGHWVLGEDSGLVVPALDGRPGVYSARYAGKQGDDDANNKRLLEELDAVPDERRERRTTFVQRPLPTPGARSKRLSRALPWADPPPGPGHRRFRLRPSISHPRVSPDLRRT